MRPITRRDISRFSVRLIMMGVILVMSLSIGLSVRAGTPSTPEAKPASQPAASQALYIYSVFPDRDVQIPGGRAA